MPTTVDKRRGQIVEVVHEPGNSTRYSVIATKVGTRWLVSLPDFGGCLWVIEQGIVHYGYVMEKLKLRNVIDASEIAKAIASVVPGVEAEGVTDDKGKRLK